MPMTMAEKILARSAGRSTTIAGEIVEAAVNVAMSHENAGMVLHHFKTIGASRVWDPERIVIVFDHRIPAESERTATTHKTIREFVRAQGIRNFYDINVGICHQVLPEHGHSRPGELLVGTDSHTTTHGAFGCFGTGIGATEMACVWATGKLWLRVPETIRIEVTGQFPAFVSAKDLVLYVIGKLGADGADYKAVEYAGPTIDAMTIASRMVLSNLSMEMGAKVAFVEPDEKTVRYVRERTDVPFEPIFPDRDAKYVQTLKVDVSTLRPQIACPHAVDNVKPIDEVGEVKVNQALLGSCTNGRLEDLQVAASILRGRKVHPETRMLVIPASWAIYEEAMKAGLLFDLIGAGAVICNPGCGPCLGVHQGILAPGERCISSTNRNFQGRMGSPEAEVYLGSPAVVAASAVAGRIIDPEKL
ncbi:MAG TPA: 3-isopropylmalate dehydratase large subunit [Phycisphaerae bacterium]|jgi:3-isopropylmalate/(R)-2-methylmalate dehydratase large subunit|nr:3-isopropylmalate dehydratase large subunit [Phycisphaerae bacterium]HOB74056.1 3-isopropylmalate dehydratase large subunit [Phycisphaerae bacterium]HOJ53813.1 3-isopropylmalate dehydratase large subunit [Phycisphaerae bacterium]HOL26144.1 3-isopropylmalate dehydratase large subunit [Phycisphaerae bacterium]HPP20131.1 3-isopropylmalate dehydratase large subunit [Phycisphaerae bacterium]